MLQWRPRRSRDGLGLNMVTYWRKRDSYLLLGLTAALGGLAGLSQWLLGPWSSVLTICGAFVAVAITVRSALRELEQQLAVGRAEQQALVSLYDTLAPRAPLPTMSGWRATPEFVAHAVTPVLLGGARDVLELGSGVSSLALGYALERRGGEGCVHSLDHDAAFAAQTRELVRLHGLEHRVKVLDAPLKPYALNGEHFVWYDLSQLPDDLSIDLLIVDGPPGLQDLARLPALPMLWERLRDPAVVVVDDAARPDERRCVASWLDTYGDRLRHEYFETSRGTSVLRVQGPRGGAPHPTNAAAPARQAAGSYS